MTTPLILRPTAVQTYLSCPRKFFFANIENAPRVVSAALSRLLNDVHPDVVRSHWSGKGDALDTIQRVAGWSRSLVSRTLGSAVQRVLRWSR